MLGCVDSFVMVMYATLIVFRREIHVVGIVAGHFLNLILNFVLKRTIQQPRPSCTNSTVYGSTVCGSTVCGSTVYGSTVYGSTVYGSTVCGEVAA